MTKAMRKKTKRIEHFEWVWMKKKTVTEAKPADECASIPRNIYVTHYALSSVSSVVCDRGRTRSRGPEWPKPVRFLDFLLYTIFYFCPILSVTSPAIAKNSAVSEIHVCFVLSRFLRISYSPTTTVTGKPSRNHSVRVGVDQ